MSEIYKEPVIETHEFDIENVCHELCFDKRSMPRYILTPKFVVEETISRYFSYIEHKEAVKKEKTDIVEFPADWWQSFKERWFPKWAIKRYPVIYTKIKIKEKLKLNDIVPSDTATHFVETIRYDEAKRI